MKFLKPGMAHLRDTNTQQVDAKVFKASVNKIGWKKNHHSLPDKYSTAVNSKPQSQDLAGKQHERKSNARMDTERKSSI